MPSPSALRLAPATVFAVACLAVSAAGHVLAGGGTPAPGVVVPGLCGLVALAYLLNGRERGPQLVLGATIGAQAVLHELFSRAAPGPTPLFEHSHVGVGMVLIHAVVGALTGWWLYRGERAFWLMARLWRMPALPVGRWLMADPPAAPAPARVTPAEDEREPGTTREIATAIPRRGPPQTDETERNSPFSSVWSSPWHSCRACPAVSRSS